MAISKPKLLLTATLLLGASMLANPPKSLAQPWSILGPGHTSSVKTRVNLFHSYKLDSIPSNFTRISALRSKLARTNSPNKDSIGALLDNATKNLAVLGDIKFPNFFEHSTTAAKQKKLMEAVNADLGKAEKALKEAGLL